jgi:hypothetical protein
VNSTDIFVGLLVIVGIFVAYELAAIKLSWFPHTISYYAKHNRRIYQVIFAGFILGGLIGAAWWRWHITYGNIPR